MKLPWQTFKWGTVNTVLATVVTHMNSISIGMCQAYSAILLPQISDDADNDENIEFTVNSNEGSWIASLGVLSNPIGALMTGILMDTYGRKASIIFTTIPFMFGWSVIALSSDIMLLCVGRCITGVAIGMASSCYMYVAEITLPSSRGFLSSFGPAFVSFGVLIIYFLGYVTTWKIIAAVCAVNALISLLAIFSIPDSPCWLASKGRIKEASDALRWLRNNGHSEAVSRELTQIIETVKLSKGGQIETCKEFLSKCCQPEVWKPFVILVAFFILQEMTGIYIVLYYTVDFFHIAGSSLNDHVASILVGVLRFFFSIVGSLCIQQFSRRRLASLSGLLMSVTMAAAAFYENTYNGIEIAFRPYSWIPLACILLNVSASTLGLLQIPWMMVGELFPLCVRGIMGGLVSSLAYFFVFVAVKFYPTIESTLHTDGIMALFSCSSLLASIFALTLLPETKDKTLSEIETSFIKKTADSSVSSSSTEKLQRSFPKAPTVPTVAIIIDNKTM